MINQNTYLDPNIWGPHYWFVLHTIAISYPLNPTEHIKKKYYDLFTNFHLFLPDTKIGNKFTKLLNKYPISPYLDSRMSLMKWTHFIHNKVNKLIGKPTISFQESLEKYHYNYIPLNIRQNENKNSNKKLIYSLICISLFLLGYVLYKE